MNGRRSSSGAIINLDSEALMNYKRRIIEKEKFESMQSHIATMGQEIQELKVLIQQLTTRS